VKHIVLNLVNGAIIGIANIIPGVSGGTMALILGFYERLIAAINNISFRTILIFLKSFSFKSKSLNDLKNEFKRIDGFFLLTIGAGALAAIVALAKLMPYLLQNYHDPTYGFFFGLILVSAIAPFKLIKKKTIPVFLTAVLAIILIVAVTNASTGDKLLEKEQTKLELKAKQAITTDTPQKSEIEITSFLYMFIIGAVAISAMILPGISGSFLLLLMGGYIDILKAVSSRDFPVLIAFAAGCIVGIALFSRLINYLLKKWHDLTMGFLVGLVVGSLWMIWPFKTSQLVGEKIVYLSNHLPATFGRSEILTLITMILGISVVTILLWIESKQEKT